MAAAPRHNLITLSFVFLGIYQQSEQLDDAAVIRDPSFPELLTCEYLAVMDDHSASARVRRWNLAEAQVEQMEVRKVQFERT
jgi:hypothetical protein